jgi:hypothetical protein
MSSELYNIWRTMLPLVKEVKPETWRILMTYPWKDSRNFKVVTTNRGGGFGGEVVSALAFHL